MQTDGTMQFQKDWFWYCIVTASPSCDLDRLRHIWSPGRIRSISRPEILKYGCPMGAYTLVCSEESWGLGRYLKGGRLWLKMKRERNVKYWGGWQRRHTKRKRGNKCREKGGKNNWPSIGAGCWGRRRIGNWRPVTKVSTNIVCSSCHNFDFWSQKFPCRVVLLTYRVGKCQVFCRENMPMCESCSNSDHLSCYKQKSVSIVWFSYISARML